MQTFSQSSLNYLFKLSVSKRALVLFHPFKATRSLKVSKEINRVADSKSKTTLLNGDAFRRLDKTINKGISPSFFRLSK